MPVRLFNDTVKMEGIFKEKDKKYLRETYNFPQNFQSGFSLSHSLQPNSPRSAPETSQISIQKPYSPPSSSWVFQQHLGQFTNTHAHVHTCTSENFLLYLSCWLAFYLFTPFPSFTFLIQFPCPAFCRKTFPPWVWPRTSSFPSSSLPALSQLCPTVSALR